MACERWKMSGLGLSRGLGVQPKPGASWVSLAPTGPGPPPRCNSFLQPCQNCRRDNLEGPAACLPELSNSAPL